MISPWFLTAFLLAAYAPQRLGTDMLPAEQEARVQAIAGNLRCAVCQGVSVADSPASMARAQLDKVRELVSQGKSDEEIREYFVSRYGEWVLMTPTSEGVNLTVWVAPVGLLLLGLFVILSQVKKPGKEAPQTSPETASVQEEDEYLKRVRAELER